MKKRRKAAGACVCLILSLLTVYLCGCESFIIHVTEDPRTTSPQTSGVPDSDTTPVTDPPVNPPGFNPDSLTYDNSDCKAAVSALRDLNLGSSTFMTAISDGVSDTLIAEGTDIAPYYAERNEMAAGKYGCRLFSRTVSAADLKKDISASVKAGSDMNSYYSDILLVDARTGGELGVSGLLLDLRKLPYYEYDTVGSRGAGMYNTFNRFCISETTNDILGYTLVYFNRALAGETGASDLYSAVRNERFTFEFFLNFIKQYGTSADYDISVSAFADNAVIAEIAAMQSGYDYVADADGVYPQLCEYKTEVTDALAGLIAGLSSLRYYTRFAETDPASSAIFSAGQSLFDIGRASAMKEMVSSPTPWGVAPLPILSDDPEIAAMSISSGGKPVICCPANNSRFELTGAMLSALNAASGSWMTTAFINVCTKNYLRDNDSYFALQSAMFSEQYYDYSDIYGSSVKNLADASSGAVRKCFTDGTSIADTVNSYRSAVNKALKSVK